MKKMMILMGLLALAVLVVGCTQGTLAGEATRTKDARQCPNGCEIIKKLNSAVVIPEAYSVTSRSCDTVCENSGRICVDAEFGIPHPLPGVVDESGATEEVIEWNMAACSESFSNRLRCRCY